MGSHVGKNAWLESVFTFSQNLFPDFGGLQEMKSSTHTSNQNAVIINGNKPFIGNQSRNIKITVS